MTPEDNAARPNPWLPEQKLRELTNAVRANVIVQRIWQTAFTEGERQQISADETMGPDIVDIWVKFKGVSPTRAVLELAREVDLISDGEFHRLLRVFGEEVKSSAPLPVWDRTVGELRLGHTVIKRVRRLKVATNAILILDAFQETGWPSHQDDPLPGKETLRQTTSQRLQDAIKSLNQNLTLIRFRGDGKGAGVVWKRI